MKTSCKVWLWLMFIMSALNTIGALILMQSAPEGVNAVLTLSVVSLVLIAFMLMLFFRRIEGFWLLIVMSVITFGVNVYEGVSIVQALPRSVLSPLLTYLLAVRDHSLTGGKSKDN